MAKLTFSMEIILKPYMSSNGIWRQGFGYSERLGVTKPRSTAQLRLPKRDWLPLRNTKIYLTPLDLCAANLQKHQIIQRFFTEVLKIDADVADQDACSIEHVISGDSIQAMQEYMQATKEK